jgi:molecular chaperone GrpE
VTDTLSLHDALPISSIVDLYDDVNLSLKFFNEETLDSLLILLNKVKNFLKSEGVEEVQVDKYDPDLHEVVQVLETGKEEIVEVLSRGYSIGGKILKYPKIILSK